jgi:hypothetical protein
VLKDA